NRCLLVFSSSCASFTCSRSIPSKSCIDFSSNLCIGIFQLTSCFVNRLIWRQRLYTTWDHRTSGISVYINTETFFSKLCLGTDLFQGLEFALERCCLGRSQFDLFALLEDFAVTISIKT